MTGNRPSVLVSGWIGADNVGDELIFRSLATKLHATGARTVAMSIHPQRTRDVHQIDAIGWSDIAGTIGALRRSNGFIVGPGGILQDETSVWNLPAHLLRPNLARAQRKPLIGIGLGAGPLRTAIGRRLVRASLRSVPLIVRDSDSADLLRRVGLQNIRVTTDLAFGLPVPVSDPVDRIVVALRPFSGSGGIIPARKSDLRSLETTDRTTVLSAALDELALRTGLPIHLLAFESERDMAFHSQVAERMVHTVTTSVADVDTVFEEVRKSRLVIAMRYHAIVAAIMALRPVVTIGYSPKTLSLSSLVGDSGMLVPNTIDGFGQIPSGATLVERTHDPQGLRHQLRSQDQENTELVDAFVRSLVIQ